MCVDTHFVTVSTYIVLQQQLQYLLIYYIAAIIAIDYRYMYIIITISHRMHSDFLKSMNPILYNIQNLSHIIIIKYKPLDIVPLTALIQFSIQL